MPGTLEIKTHKSWYDKLLAALTAIATGSINFSNRVWHDVSIAIYRDIAIFKTGKDPGFDALKNIDSISPSDVAQIVGTGTASIFTKLFEITGGALEPVITALIKVHSNTLDTLQNVAPGDEADAATKLLGEAAGAGVGAHFAAVLGETIYPTKTLGMPQVAALMAELAGFKEIMAGIIEPEVAQLITVPHRYHINSRARSLLPGLAAALGMRARGIIDDATRDNLVGFAGLSRDYAAAEQTAAYHGYSPRMLLRVIESNLFTQDEINEELTFSGMRPASQARMLKAAPYLATATYRSELRNSLHAAFVAGLISEAELTSDVDAAESNVDRDDLILRRSRLDKRLAGVKELENTYSIQFIGHLIDLPTYQSLLEGLGLQSDKVNNLLAISEARANAAVERQLEADERQLERQTKSDLRKAALRNYKNGAIDAAVLATELIATGLSATQVVAWTDLATLEQAGAARFLYGQLLSPSDAKLLTDRITAIETQLKKGFIPLAGAREQLVNLGLDKHELAALLAKWAAAIGAANSHGQLLDIITGAVIPPPKPPPTP